MLTTAFLLGFLGSFHCIGMCGPIAVALPLSRRERWGIVWASGTYNLGRLMTYAFIGLIFGAIGWGIQLAGAQKVLSVLLGLTLLAFAIAPRKTEATLLSIPLLSQAFSAIKRKIGLLFRQNSWKNQLSIGILNGFLPCGLVYVAIAGAMGMGNMWSGALFMAAFGAGTLPMMMGLTIVGQFVPTKLRQRLSRLAPVVMVVFAILLISRGFNVPIPRELEFWQAIQNPVLCH